MIHNIIDSISVIDFNILLFLGIIILLGSLGGRLFQKIKFPQVVGYIIIGILIGQTGIHIITKDLIGTMHPVNTFALGIIGFMIGSELKVSVIRKYGKQFSIILLFESLSAFLVVSALVTAIAFLILRDFKTAISIGLLLGAISSATAPAATTDVLWENKTKGPLTTIVFGLVAMDDGVALLLFAVASSIASVLLGNGGTNIGGSIFSLVYEIFGALILGSVTGFALSKLIKGFVDEDRILVYSLSSLLLLIGLSQVLNLNVILATMTVGFFMSNFAPRKSIDTFKLIQKFSPPIYILFFVLVGAELNISNLSLLAAALAGTYLFGRIGGKYIGARLGAKLSRAPKTVRKFLGMCLLSQAGVAIGLAILAEKDFAGNIGDLIVIIITTTTFIVQLIGPILVKIAAVKSGEAGLNRTEEDLLQSSSAEDLMHKGLSSIKVDTKIKNILKEYSENDEDCYPVLDDENHVHGIITIDNVKALITVNALDDVLLAHDIMEPVVRSCKKDTPAITVKEELKKYNIPGLPVLDENDKYAGMIESRSVEKYLSHKIWEMDQKAASME